MIKRSESITIIYGGRAKAYANKIKDMLNLEKKKHSYGINVEILLERVINLDVLAEVLDIVKKTKLAIIFLSKDDVIYDGEVKKYRARQNVILEIGMLLSTLPYEHCIFLSDFPSDDISFEMPSDLKKIFPTYFNSETIDEVFKSVIEKSKDILKLKDYSDLIYKNNYYFKYSELFSKEDLLSIYEKPINMQNDEVLRLWLNELKSLDDIPQALIYTLERLPLTNLYRYSKYHEAWFNEVFNTIKELVDNDPKRVYKLTLDLIEAIIKYTSIKADLSNKLITKEEARISHLELYDELKDIVEEIDSIGELNNNIVINAYDYLALEGLRVCDTGYSKEIIKEAIGLFLKCREIASNNDDTIKLWSGYLEYNLARAYQKYMALYNDLSYIDKLYQASNRAVKTRKGWLNVRSFPECLNNAMGYEYFNALIFSYKAHSDNNYDKEILNRKRAEIKDEFKHYYSSDQTNNQLLFEIKDLIDEIDNN